MPAPFDVRVRHKTAVAVIDLSGELNATAEGQLDGAYDEAATHDPATVVLNFEQVDYINSTGIALIVGLLAKARRDGRTVAACGLIEHYQEIFRITRLADFMALYPDEGSAVHDVPAVAG